MCSDRLCCQQRDRDQQDVPEGLQKRRASMVKDVGDDDRERQPRLAASSCSVRPRVSASEYSATAGASTAIGPAALSR